MHPDLADAWTDRWHRFPVVGIEALLHAPELEARIPPRIGGEGAEGGQGAAEPRDGLIRHASIYKGLRSPDGEWEPGCGAEPHVNWGWPSSPRGVPS
jgi:hypothetical protein